MLCLECELPDLLETSRPPDPEPVDMIEWALIEDQINSKKADQEVSNLTGREGGIDAAHPCAAPLRGRCAVQIGNPANLSNMGSHPMPSSQ
jgi:hypothetical protein